MLRVLEAPFKTLHEGSFLRYFSLSPGWHEDQRTTSWWQNGHALHRRLLPMEREERRALQSHSVDIGPLNRWQR
jgi:hypothetical protein